MQIIDTTFPCDTLILKEKLIYGSYAYEEGERSGEVCFYDFKSLTGVKFRTTGTFCLKEKDELVYAANSCNIQVYKDEKLVKTIQTKGINTYLSIDSHLGVSTTAGELKLFDNFEEIHTYTLTNNTLWSVDQQNSLFVLGGEVTNLFLVDIRTNTSSVIKSEMSPCVKFKDNFVYAGTYDGMVNVYDLRYNKLYDKFVGGQIWQLSFDNKLIVCACVYDGVKVLDYDFNIKNSFECGSIVYACDYYKGILAYSSFYEKKIYLKNVNF